MSFGLNPYFRRFNYATVEDPFSIISTLAPDPLSRPNLAPLYPPLFYAPNISYPSSSHTHPHPPPPPPSSYPTSVNLPIDHCFTTQPSTSKPRRHWTIARNVTRNRARGGDDDLELPEEPSWKTPREAHATDFGSFAFLAGKIEEEMRRRHVIGHEGEEAEKVLATIKETLDPDSVITDIPNKDTSLGPAEYWNIQRAGEAEGYIRDVVYGGVDGLSYVRSLAEFVNAEERHVRHSIHA